MPSLGEEVGVVAHHEQRALVLRERTREARPRGLIQVVRRLVEEQEVGPGRGSVCRARRARSPRLRVPTFWFRRLSPKRKWARALRTCCGAAEAQRLHLLPDAVRILQVLQLLPIPAQLQVAVAADAAGVRRQIAGEDAQQGGLPGAVLADEAEAGGGSDLEGRCSAPASRRKTCRDPGEDGGSMQRRLRGEGDLHVPRLRAGSGSASPAWPPPSRRRAAA